MSKRVGKTEINITDLSKNHAGFWNRKKILEKVDASRTNTCMMVHRGKVRITKAGNEMQLSQLK